MGWLGWAGYLLTWDGVMGFRRYSWFSLFFFPPRQSFMWMVRSASVRVQSGFLLLWWWSLLPLLRLYFFFLFLFSSPSLSCLLLLPAGLISGFGCSVIPGASWPDGSRAIAAAVVFVLLVWSKHFCLGWDGVSSRIDAWMDGEVGLGGRRGDRPPRVCCILRMRKCV